MVKVLAPEFKSVNQHDPIEKLGGGFVSAGVFLNSVSIWNELPVRTAAERAPLPAGPPAGTPHGSELAVPTKPWCG